MAPARVARRAHVAGKAALDGLDALERDQAGQFVPGDRRAGAGDAGRRSRPRPARRARRCARTSPTPSRRRRAPGRRRRTRAMRGKAERDGRPPRRAAAAAGHRQLRRRLGRHDTARSLGGDHARRHRARLQRDDVALDLDHARARPSIVVVAVARSLIAAGLRAEVERRIETDVRNAVDRRRIDRRRLEHRNVEERRVPRLRAAAAGSECCRRTA